MSGERFGGAAGETSLRQTRKRQQYRQRRRHRPTRRSASPNETRQRPRRRPGRMPDASRPDRIRPLLVDASHPRTATATADGDGTGANGVAPLHERHDERQTVTARRRCSPARSKRPRKRRRQRRRATAGRAEAAGPPNDQDHGDGTALETANGMQADGRMRSIRTRSQERHGNDKERRHRPTRR